jgi:hypothetical protein
MHLAYLSYSRAWETVVYTDMSIVQAVKEAFAEGSRILKMRDNII